MVFSMILFVAAYIPRNWFKAKFHHPQVLSVKTWAVAHLLSNGVLSDVLLFGGDFQLARAGGLHHEASSAHGVLLVVHGDLDLDVVSPDPH